MREDFRRVVRAYRLGDVEEAVRVIVASVWRRNACARCILPKLELGWEVPFV